MTSGPGSESRFAIVVGPEAMREDVEFALREAQARYLPESIDLLVASVHIQPFEVSNPSFSSTNGTIRVAARVTLPLVLETMGHQLTGVASADLSVRLNTNPASVVAVLDQHSIGRLRLQPVEAPRTVELILDALQHHIGTLLDDFMPSWEQEVVIATNDDVDDIFGDAAGPLLDELRPQMRFSSSLTRSETGPPWLTIDLLARPQGDWEPLRVPTILRQESDALYFSQALLAHAIRAESKGELAAYPTAPRPGTAEGGPLHFVLQRTQFPCFMLEATFEFDSAGRFVDIRAAHTLGSRVALLGRDQDRRQTMEDVRQALANTRIQIDPETGGVWAIEAPNQ